MALSESYLKRQIHAGNLRARMVDRKYRIGHEDLKAWFETLPEADTWRTPYPRLHGRVYRDGP